MTRNGRQACRCGSSCICICSSSIHGWRYLERCSTDGAVRGMLMTLFFALGTPIGRVTDSHGKKRLMRTIMQILSVCLWYGWSSSYCSGWSIESNQIPWLFCLLVANERKERKISKYSLAFRSFIREENKGITTTMTLSCYEPTARLHFSHSQSIHSSTHFVHIYIHTYTLVSF